MISKPHHLRGLRRPTGRMLLLAFVLAALLAGCTGSGDKAAAKGTLPADYTRMDGADLQAMVRETTESGKAVLLAFWTTWCPGCRQELPELVQLRKEYPEDKLAIAIVALDDEEKVIRAFFKEHGSPGFPVLHGTRDAATVYQINAIPNLVLVDAEGKRLFNQPGAFPAAMLRKVVDQAVR